MRVAVAFAVRFVHAFMQHLGLFPRVLVAGSGGEGNGSGAKEDRGGFHGGIGSAILSPEAPRANGNSMS